MIIPNWKKRFPNWKTIKDDNQDQFVKQKKQKVHHPTQDVKQQKPIVDE